MSLLVLAQGALLPGAHCRTRGPRGRLLPVLLPINTAWSSHLNGLPQLRTRQASPALLRARRYRDPIGRYFEVVG